MAPPPLGRLPFYPALALAVSDPGFFRWAQGQFAWVCRNTGPDALVFASMNLTFAAESPAEILFEPEPCPPPRPRLRTRLARGVGRVVRGVTSAMDWLFGAAALVIGLSALSAIPIAQFLGL